MAEFVYFKNACRMWYPVGQYFSSDNFDYIREAASLSPLIVQQMMLDKWDGKLPVYGTVPTLFKDIAGK